MRIALVVPGGVDRSLEYRVIPALIALIVRLSRDHDVQVIALNQEPRAGQWMLANARIHNIGAPFTRLRALLAVYRLHRAEPFDVVQAIWSASCGMICVTAGMTLRIPSVVHVAGGELVWIPEIHYGGAGTLLGRAREFCTLHAASAVSAASQPTIDLLTRKRVVAHRIPLGVDLDIWPARRPLRRNAGAAARLVHVASLNPVKDQTTLLRALASLKGSGVRFQMDIVGEDIQNGRMQILSEQLGLLPEIRFLGFRTQKQLRPILEAADLLVMSSRHETGPLVVLEAAVAGVPSVGTMVGHVAEWAPTAALSAPIGDWAALGAEMRRLLVDEDLRLQIAEEALKRATDEDADHTARRFTDLYEQLIKLRNSPAQS
jgi:glycosyltransferase involved in cell wall biosynthesis